MQINRLAMLIGSAVLLLTAACNVAALDEPSLRLSDEAEEAVNAGVVLTFTGDYARREQWGPFFRTHERHTHRFTLTRHALSNKYIVKIDGSGSPKLFRSVTEAVNFVSHRSHKLLETYSSNETPFSMRVTLNKYELPAPMRLKAFVADAWDIDTGWITWTSVN